MRQNNETMLARHTPHSTHCLKRLNSLNCLIKSVKTLQTVIKLTIVFLLCSRKLFNLVFLYLSLSLNIAMIYCSFIVRRWYFNLCSVVVNICSSYLFTSLKFTGCPAILNGLQTVQETHFLYSLCQQNLMNCVITLTPKWVTFLSKVCIVCVCLCIWEGCAWPQLSKQASVLPSLIRDISKTQKPRF